MSVRPDWGKQWNHHFYTLGHIPTLNQSWSLRRSNNEEGVCFMKLSPNLSYNSFEACRVILSGWRVRNTLNIFSSFFESGVFIMPCIGVPAGWWRFWCCVGIGIWGDWFCWKCCCFWWSIIMYLVGVVWVAAVVYILLWLSILTAWCKPGCFILAGNAQKETSSIEWKKAVQNANELVMSVIFNCCGRIFKTRLWVLELVCW